MNNSINLGTVLFVILIALAFIILYNMIFASNCENLEQMIDISPVENPQWSRTECKYTIGDTLQQVMKDNNIVQAPLNKEGNSGNSGNLQLTCGYDEIDKEINKLSPTNDQRIFIIHNADHISAKDYLWDRLVLGMGIDKAKTIMPNTYILKRNEDKERLKRDFKAGNLYIMKKNIQRQEGLKITDSLNEILNAPSSFVLAQELLQNPYLINVSQNSVPDNRKINMRFYVLVVCKDRNMDVYVFNDGFMYYTKEAFKVGSKQNEHNVTTGYIDRWIYDKNPLTHADFREYLDRHDRPLTQSEKNIRDQHLKLSNVVFNRIYNTLRETFICVIGKVCEGDKLNSNISFQLFGADIALSDQLQPMVMEVNKGPDMGAKDDRDGVVKRKCTADMLRIVGVVDRNSNNGFIQIINKEDDLLGLVNI